VRRHRLWPTVSAVAVSTLRNAMEDGLRRVEKTGSSGFVTVLNYWIPVPRLREDEFYGNDRKERF
ncbi:MAG: hypothetical protein V1930_03150, partial [Pseudomonadota bacterium]